MARCSICGMKFEEAKEIQQHKIDRHDFAKEESLILKKAGEEEKARKRSRGPYRKANTA